MYITELIHVEYWENSTSYPLFKKSREYHGLIYSLGDNAVVTMNGKTFRPRTNEVIYYRRGEQYYIELECGRIKNIVIDFLGEGFDETFFVRDCEDLLPQFKKLLQMWNKRGDSESSHLECMSLVYSITAQVLRRRDMQGIPKRWREQISPVLDYIHERYTSPDIKASELSSLIGVSERYLYRIFSETVGMSPKKYISSLRLKYANELLDIGYSVSETAQRVGFRDVYHFSSFYKKERGITPSQKKNTI